MYKQLVKRKADSKSEDNKEPKTEMLEGKYKEGYTWIAFILRSCKPCFETAQLNFLFEIIAMVLFEVSVKMNPDI